MENNVTSTLSKTLQNDRAYRQSPAVSHSLLNIIESGQAEKPVETIYMLKGTVFHYLMETGDLGILQHVLTKGELDSVNKPMLLHTMNGCTPFESYFKVFNNANTRKYLSDPSCSTKAVLDEIDKATSLADKIEKILDKLKSGNYYLDTYGHNPELWFKGGEIALEARNRYEMVVGNTYYRSLLTGIKVESELPIHTSLPTSKGLIAVKGKLDKLVHVDEQKLRIIDYKTFSQVESRIESGAVWKKNVRQLSYYAHILLNHPEYTQYNEVEVVLVYVMPDKVRFLTVPFETLKKARDDQFVKFRPYHWYNAQKQYDPFLNGTQLSYIREHFWETDNARQKINGWQPLLEQAAIRYPEYLTYDKNEQAIQW